MKYLIDEALIVESVIAEEVNESTGKKEKNYYIEGVFSTPGQKNRNGRIYPLNIWEREVTKYQEEIKNNSMNTLGEWEHPPRSSVDPLQAVMKIVELKMDNGLVMGKAKILNNNSEKTNQLKALIDEGMKIGVSSRGTGSVKGDVVENFSLTTYDAVSFPSDYNANLTGLCESLENSVIVGENIENQIDEANKKLLDAKYQVEINQIFNSENIEEMLKIAEKLEDKKDKYLLTTYLNLIKKTDIKPTEKVKLIVEEFEEKLRESKELSDFEKKILAEKFMDKFSNVLKGITKSDVLNEAMKVTSKSAAINALQMLLIKIEDVKQKDLINSVIEFLSKN